MGHISLCKLKHIAGFHTINQLCDCDTCLYAKFNKLPFPRSSNRAKNCFDLIHMDLWGPYMIHALNGASYILTIIDDHSRATWTFLLHNQMQVYKTDCDFFAHVLTQFDKIIKVVRYNQGTEFIIQSKCGVLFSSKGSIHQTSVVGVPQQNG